jgi:hypothetical protein
MQLDCHRYEACLNLAAQEYRASLELGHRTSVTSSPCLDQESSVLSLFFFALRDESVEPSEQG